MGEETERWARLILVEGSSRHGRWDFGADAAGARVVLGTDPTCDWPLKAARVAARHCEFYWNGESLWIADAGTGQLFVDGSKVTQWRQLTDRVRVQLGGAVLVAQVSPASSTTLAEDPPQSSGWATGEHQIGAPHDQSPQDAPPWSGGGAAASSAAGATGTDAEITRAVASPPHMENAYEAIARANAAETTSPVGNAPRSEPLPAEATRIMMDYPSPEAPMVPDPVRGGPAYVPPPRLGAGRVAVEPLAAHGGLVPAGAAPMPTRTAQAAPMAHPVYPQTHEEPTPPIGSPPSGNGDATPADRFVLPPDQAAALRAERGAAKLASSGARKPMLPLRTWVLLIITMLVTMCVLIFIVKKRRNQALMAQQTQQVQPPVLPPPTGPSPIQPPVPGTTLEPGPVNPPEPGAGPDEAPTANADAQGEQQPPPPAPAAGTQPDSVPAGPTPARGAADLVVARRYVDALPRYEELARQNPENTAYAAMVTVLRQKVRAMCHNGQLASGEPCPVQ